MTQKSTLKCKEKIKTVKSQISLKVTTLEGDELNEIINNVKVKIIINSVFK